MSRTEKFDVIVVGTGFASSFFLHSYLKKARRSERILVLERGFIDSHAWQIANGKTSRIDHETTFVNRGREKEWLFSVGFGGSSNCWWASTPRFLPNDFELQSRYGVGRNWPVTYDDLEPYYLAVEQIMAISGPSGNSPYPRSAPYPQPPHLMTDPDRLLRQANPESFFNMPTARASVATSNRSRCCVSGACFLCPANAKFTILNEMANIYDDPRLTLELGAEVQTVNTAGGIAQSVSYLQDGPKEAQADLVVLGANALFNPHILLRSGLQHPMLGSRLNEQIGVQVTVDLEGLDNYQGSTSITGASYMHYDGPHRVERGAVMAITYNSPQLEDALRLERGKWRRRLLLGVSIEDLPGGDNFVAVNEANPRLPEAVYQGYSEYAQRSVDALPQILPQMLNPLPVERITISKPGPTLAHIQGTAVMGGDPRTSVVDRNLVHHEVRNLLVLGSSAFPTCPPAMPTLTLSALSLWAADHL